MKRLVTNSICVYAIHDGVLIPHLIADFFLFTFGSMANVPKWLLVALSVAILVRFWMLRKNAVIVETDSALEFFNVWGKKRLSVGFTDICEVIVVQTGDGNEYSVRFSGVFFPSLRFIETTPFSSRDCGMRRKTIWMRRSHST